MDIPLGSRPKPSRAPWFILGFGLIVFGVAAYTGLRVGAPPVISISPAPKVVGREASITVTVVEPNRGLVTVAVALVQGAERIVLAEETFAPQPAWIPWGPKTGESKRSLFVGKDHQPALKEGPATIEVRASGAPTWLFDGPQVIDKHELTVRLTPPSIVVATAANEINPVQGGVEAVVYTVGSTSVKDGVVAGRWFFQGYPKPGGRPNERVALFAVPYDMQADGRIVLTAEDEVGNRQQIEFFRSFSPRKFKTDTINVSDRVMRTVVPKIRANTPDLADKGTLLDNYILINRDLRKANNARLEAVAARTKTEVLWSKPFIQLPGSDSVSAFADRRTYRYKGQPIDRQDHLGFDLASVRHAEIPAANDGIVVLSEYLGIYGNTVVIDHGLGLMSLYAHCSTVAVKDGDRVTRGQIIGRTGATGLALGDHLHFSMMLGGLPVNSLEWWDPCWILNRLERKLPGLFDIDEAVQRRCR